MLSLCRKRNCIERGYRVENQRNKWYVDFGCKWCSNEISTSSINHSSIATFHFSNSKCTCIKLHIPQCIASWYNAKFHFNTYSYSDCCWLKYKLNLASLLIYTSITVILLFYSIAIEFIVVEANGDCNVIQKAEELKRIRSKIQFFSIDFQLFLLNKRTITT